MASLWEYTNVLWANNPLNCRASRYSRYHKPRYISVCVPRKTLHLRTYRCVSRAPSAFYAKQTTLIAQSSISKNAKQEWHPVRGWRHMGVHNNWCDPSETNGVCTLVYHKIKCRASAEHYNPFPFPSFPFHFIPSLPVTVSPSCFSPSSRKSSEWIAYCVPTTTCCW